MVVSTLHAPKPDTFLLAEPANFSDTVNLSTTANGWYVGRDGDVSVLLTNGTSVIFANMLAGMVMRLRILRVNLTGTTNVGPNDVIVLY